MPAKSRLNLFARRSRPHVVALVVAAPVLALASAQALTAPAAEGSAAEGLEARAGASGVAGSDSGRGGAAGSGWDGLGGGGPGGRAGSSGRDGARPLDAPVDHAEHDSAALDSAHSSLATTAVARNRHPTTLRRGVQMGNGSEQALGDQAGSLEVPAPAADLMVTANGSCGDEADQVGVARNPCDRAP